MVDNLILRSPTGCATGAGVLTADEGADGTLNTGLGGSACIGLPALTLLIGGSSADFAALAEVNASFTFFNLGGPSVETDGDTDAISVRPSSSSSTASDCRFFL